MTQVTNKMTLKLLLLVCIVFKQIENNHIGAKSMKISPSNRIFKEVKTSQAIKCINNQIVDSPNGTSVVLYTISCRMAKSITVKFTTKKTIGTSKEKMNSISSTNCRDIISNFNATVLSMNTVGVVFSSEEPAKYKISCINAKDKYEAYTRVQFGYPPSLASIHIERDVFDDISIFITPYTHQKNQIPEYWNITCQCSDMNDQWIPCKIKEKNETWLKINCYSKIKYCFNITGRGLFGSYSKVHKFLITEIPVRLPDFENITKSVSSYSINLSLQVLSIPEVVSLQIDYKVIYRSERDPTGRWKTKRSISGEIKLNDLHPFTKYTILASAKEKWSTIWNKNVTLIIKTKAAAPSSSPSTTNGSYFDSICPDTNKRCLTVFWQSLPIEFRNDELTGYCVQYINGSSSAFSTEQCLDSNNLVVDPLYKDFQDLPRNQTLTFSIVAVTKSRRMSQPTFIEVKNTAPRKPTAVYATKISDTMYNVSWLIEQPQETVNITVFWCQNKITYSKIECRDHVNWKTVGNGSYLLVNFSLEQSPVFAVHVSSEEGSSSLKKAECIFTPGKPTKPQKPGIIWAETKFSLTWPNLLCSDLNGIPVAYVLHYKQGGKCENGKKKEFPMIGIKAVENNVDINGLEPDTEYSVCIQVKTRDGISLMSDVITNTTKITENTEMFLIIIPIVLAVIGIVIGIAFLYKCRKRYVKISKSIKIEYTRPDSRNDCTEQYYSYPNAEIDNNVAIPLSDMFVLLQSSEETVPRDSSHCDSEDNSSANSLQTNATICSEPRVPLIRHNATSNREELPYFNQPTDYLFVNGDLKENVFSRTDYVGESSDNLSKLQPTTASTCMNGDLEKNASHRMDYVDGPSDSSSELSSMSVPTNGNLKENVSSRMDYVDEPRGSNSNPLCKNTNSKGSIPDYIFSEPDYILQFPEESTNSSESKPLNRPILQIESKENNQKENSKCNGRTDEEHVKVTLNDGYIPYEHIVEAKGSSLDEINDKNIQKDKQGISQNPNSCDLVNINVHNSSDSLQRQDKQMNKLQAKDTEQKPDTPDYFKTDLFNAGEILL